LGTGAQIDRAIQTAEYTGPEMPARNWPSLREEDRWLTEAMEERLHSSDRTPDELWGRARELRDQAEQSDTKGVRDAALALAERYEEEAASRSAAR